MWNINVVHIKAAHISVILKVTELNQKVVCLPLAASEKEQHAQYERGKEHFH